jgi:hypothetical protein
MISLKLLVEGTGDYIGHVDYSGFIEGYEILDPTDQHLDYGVGNGDRWRYYNKYKEVVWTDDPPSMEYIYI